MAKDIITWPNKSREIASAQQKRRLYSKRSWREGNKFKHRIIIESETYTGEANSEAIAEQLAKEKVQKAGIDLKKFDLV